MMNIDLDSLFSLKNKVALIVGAGGCIGSNISRTFARLGAVTLLADIDEKAVTELQQELQNNSCEALAIKMNITDKANVQDSIDHAVKIYGRIDILVNSAGFSYLENAVTFDEDKWDLLMDINIKGVFLTCQAVGKHMINQNWGRIVNFSSVRGLQGRAQDLAYAPSKGAVNQLTRSLAIEWAKYNINVNAIAPSFIYTGLNKDLLDDCETRTWVLSRIPKNRLGNIEDILGPLIFLCSPASEFVTGHILYVDGGWTAS